jgi:hypothetical protein
MSTSSEAKNLEAISRAIDQHNATCEYPAVAVAMNPFEVERLGWDNIRGLPIRGDANLGTGAFRIVCGRDEVEDEDFETVVAVSEQYVGVGAPVGSPGGPGSPGRAPGDDPSYN